MNPKINHQARIPAQRPPSPIYHHPGTEPVRNCKSDLQTNCIPTLVNGHVNGIVSRKKNNHCANKKHQWKQAIKSPRKQLTIKWQLLATVNLKESQ
jgi:hypothetical protein